MNRNWKFTLPALLVMGSALSACVDDRPGRHGPPRHGNDRYDRHDRHDRDGHYDRGRPGDGRPDRGDWRR